MEPRGAVEEARWNPFSAAMPSEDSEIMAQLLGPFSYTNEQGQKDLSFGLSSMSWSSDHAADSYYSSSENVNSCSKLYYWSQGSDSSSSSSFFCRSSGYESYYLSETNADPAVNTSFASASYCMIGEQLVLPSLDAIPNPPFGSANETSSDNIGDSSLNLLEPVPPHVRMSLPKRKSYASEDDNPSDMSKKKAKAKAPASVPKNAKKAQSRRPQKTTKSCDEEETNAASNGQSSGSRFSEADSQADQNGGSSTISGLPSLNLTGKKGAGRGSSTDPQSLYARKRRERINERLRILQNLVPNGTKVDISTMLEEAVQYVKFLQLQIKLLSSDELWMYAPIAYNGMNIGLDLKISPPQ